MVAEEVILPLLSVEEAISPDEPDSGCVEKQEEHMGIFQTLDRLEEAVDALLNAKSAASSSTLQQNLKAKNTKKLINCTICTRSFAKLGNLKIHMRVHTGEKPYTCPRCIKSFSQSSSLRSHMRVHTGDTIFACSLCTKNFGDSQALQRHLRVHTGRNHMSAPSVLSRFPDHLICSHI
jgi:hypothetical protein